MSSYHAPAEEKEVKIKDYSELKTTLIDNDKAKGVAARVVIGKNDGAENFCMRVFEIAAGGHTPKHSHEWEHEIFIHSGKGEIYGNGRWNPVESDRAVFIPANEEHQIRNTGNDALIFICLIPSTAPEL
jgi:quercetin dioxygenase-like cupin family protein